MSQFRLSGVCYLPSGNKLFVEGTLQKILQWRLGTINLKCDISTFTSQLALWSRKLFFQRSKSHLRVKVETGLKLKR